MASLRHCVPLLLGALLASACKDPAPSTGTLVVVVDGLPGGANPSVRISGPAGFFKLVQATTTLESLEPGDYIVRADTLLVSGTKYGVATVRDTISIVRGATERKTLAYAVSSGSLTVTVGGLPPGIPGNVRVNGPGYAATVTVSGTLSGLRAGQYVLEVDTMTSIQGDRFGTARIRDTVNVALSATPATAAVNYVLVSGTLALTVNGLPSVVTPAQPVSVSGPGGFQFATSASGSVRGLSAGTYTITASMANGACPNVYKTSSTPQTVEIVVGQTGTATVTYTEGQADPADLNLKIAGLHLIQVTQDFAGNVPMLSGKPALLRVFGTANQCNTAAPKVRVTLGSGEQFVINAQEQSVRISPDQSTLLASWNVTLPGAAVQLQPNLTVVAEIDPDGAIAEANEADNRYPATGALTISVVQAPTVKLRFVPVTVNATTGSLTGNITGTTIDRFMDVAKSIHPVGTYAADIREPYSATVTSLGASGTNWAELLGEIRVLQRADTDPTRFYYGVVKVSYSSGVAGIAYVGGRAGMGWDHLPSGSQVLAHELGHNYFRGHAPCGGPNDPDPSYPGTGLYAGGHIGVYGYDGVNLRSPDAYADIMGYCDPKWISDYTYLGMLNYLQNTSLSVAAAGSNAEQPSVLIWGRIVNGQPTLEPAFEISARPALPSGSGRHRIAALDEMGGEIFSYAFAGERIADLPGEYESFAFVVPRSALRGRALGSLRLTTRGRTVSSVASVDVAADPRIVASRPGPGRVRLQWDASRFPVVMVRNPASGQIIAFARGGDATIVAGQNELDLNFSNRVRSARQTVRVLR